MNQPDKTQSDSEYGSYREREVQHKLISARQEARTGSLPKPSSNVERPYHQGIQLLRALLSLFVVYNHVPPEGLSSLPLWLQEAVQLLCTVAVPCFVLTSFFLSGSSYTQNRHISGRQFTKRMKRLLLPFIGWSAVGFVVYAKRISLANLVLQMFLGGVVNAPLYYLVIVIYFTILFAVLTRLSIRPRLMSLVFLASFCVFAQYSGINCSLFVSFGDSSRYTLGRFSELLPHAITGLLLRRFLEIRRCCEGNLPHHRWWLGIALLVFGVGALVWVNDNLAGFGYQGIGLLLCSSSLFVLFLLQPDSRIAKAVPSAAMSISSVSLGVFCSHYLLNRIVRSWFGHSAPYDVLTSVPFLYGFMLYAGSALLCRRIKQAFGGRLADFVS